MMRVCAIGAIKFEMYSAPIEIRLQKKAQKKIKYENVNELLYK